MPYIPPIDGLAVLQVQATLTASTNSPAYDAGDGYDASNSLGQLVAGVVEVTAGTFASHTYTFKIQESADGSTGWADVSPGVAATAVGVVVVKAVITKRFVRLVMTATGSTPSIAYNSNLAVQ
jgi:hypothetical protein